MPKRIALRIKLRAIVQCKLRDMAVMVKDEAKVIVIPT